MSRVPTSAQRVNVSAQMKENMKRSIPGSNTQTSAGQVSYNPMQASRNDIIYCGDVVVKLAQRISTSGTGAHHGPLKSYAMGITSVTDTMSPFIQQMFKMSQAGMLKNQLAPTQEELQCMQATFWYEQELAKHGSVENIPFLKSNIIYQGNGNGNGANGNGVNASGDSGSSANGNGDDFPFVALGLGGLAVIGLGLWYISSREEDPMPTSVQRFQHPVFN